MGYFYNKLTELEKKEVDKEVNRIIRAEYDMRAIDIAVDLLDGYREDNAKLLYGVKFRDKNLLGLKDVTNGKFISRMEKFIQSILACDLEIKYEFDKQFKYNKKVSRLKFDFVLENGFIIEYDGEQHFNEIEMFSCYYGYDFKQGIKNDNIKNEFCLENNVPILRIPYTYHTCSKQTRKQLYYLIKYFIEKQRVPSHIIEFYELNSESNYANIALRLNESLAK